MSESRRSVLEVVMVQIQRDSVHWLHRIKRALEITRRNSDLLPSSSIQMLSRLRPPSAHRLRVPPSRRLYATERYNPTAIERESDDVDVCIVGAGPSGLSAAIRIKQLNADLRVVVLEKGSEVGAHILSGCCLEPRALRELLGSDYSEKYGPPPAMQAATHDRMLYLASATTSIPLPHPPQMSNTGNFIISLSEMTRWLSNVAEEHYGVEVYPGFGGASLVYSEAEESNDPWDGWTGKWGKEVTKIFKEAPGVCV